MRAVTRDCQQWFFMWLPRRVWCASSRQCRLYVVPPSLSLFLCTSSFPLNSPPSIHLQPPKIHGCCLILVGCPADLGPTARRLWLYFGTMAMLIRLVFF